MLKTASFSVLFFAMCSCCTSILAQEAPVDSVQLELELAQYHFDFGDYQTALKGFNEFLEKRDGDEKVKLLRGICMFELGNNSGALEQFREIEGFQGERSIYVDKFRDAYYTENIEFLVARCLYYDGQFAESLKKFETATAGLQSEDEVSKSILRQFVEWATNGIELTDLSRETIKIENLGPRINSQYDDVAPLITADEKSIVFTSKRPSGMKGTMDQNGHHREDIYISHVQTNGKWYPPYLISQSINHKYHDACIGLSPDGNYLLLYITKKSGKGDIYECHRKKNAWTSPKKLKGGINSKYHESSASMGMDDKVIYFSSDRPGGKGGKDIYMSKLLPTGEWSEARNLNFNTDKDEFCPFIHADGYTLYFSSKGYKSVGGYDLFKTIYDPETDTWSDPQNLGYPINTARDEIFFTWSPDGRRAYFSSDRDDSFGGLDLYKMVYEEGTVSTMLLTGRIIDGETQEPIKARIKITELKSRDIVAILDANEETGDYTVSLPPGKSYSMLIEASNYLPQSAHFEVEDKYRYYEEDKTFELQKLKEGSITVLNNVFFDLNSSDLKEESFEELDKFARVIMLSKDIDVEIAGHTEAGGKKEYNLELSTARAQSVVDYLVIKGVTKERLFPIGYGAKFPVTKLRSEAEKAKNRRTELIVHQQATKEFQWDPYYERKSKE